MKLDAQKSEAILDRLFRSMDQRWRPEDVLRQVVRIIDQSEARGMIQKVLNHQDAHFVSLMSDDYQRPIGLRRQLKVAGELFDLPVDLSDTDVHAIERWIESAEQRIAKTVGKNDFLQDRLSRRDRLKAGIEISRRQYNKRFRMAVRLEAKKQKLVSEQFKRCLTLVSDRRLASQIRREEFVADRNTAAFIAYYVARSSIRCLFTVASQVRPFDTVCELLLERCLASAETTNWWAIAHVFPDFKVLEHLSIEQKGILLGQYFNVLQDAARLLWDLDATNDIAPDMVVKRGNDSSTWNLAAGAWNQIRSGWFSLVDSLGFTECLEQMCPGKVLKLMACDVVMWHSATGRGLHPDTLVWKDLPKPWEVLSGEASCPKSLVESVCVRHGVDPVKSGWTAAQRQIHVEEFTPTPELVHGVVISSPLLANLMRKAGVFSGQSVTKRVPDSTVDEIRQAHGAQQESRRNRQESEQN